MFPFRGGVWERITKSIHKITRAVVECDTLDDFHLATLMVDIEQILGNLPIIDVSSDTAEFSALTPNMLSTESLDDGIPSGIFLDKKHYCKSWRKTQAVADQF